jgi:hypothetical protein
MSRNADLRACMADFHSVLEAEDAAIIYTPAGGAATPVPDALFRSPHSPVVAADIEFDGVGPVFYVHAADAPNLAEGDGFTRAGVVYVVTETAKPDGALWRAFCRVVP